MKSIERSVLWVGLDEFYEHHLEPAGFEVDIEASDAMTKIFEEWNEAVAQEPVLSSLGVLANREQMWVGTEDELWRELAAIVDERGMDRDLFPEDAEGLYGYINRVFEISDAFHHGNFGLLDWRECTKEDRGYYHVPGWSREAPIYVGIEGAGLKPRFEEAVHRLHYRGGLLCVAVLNSTQRSRRWSGYTSELADRLAKYYPLPGRDPYWMFPRGFEDWDSSEIPGYSLDLLELYKRMDQHTALLGEEGIEVTRRKPSGERTHWTIEAPVWDLRGY